MIKMLNKPSIILLVFTLWLYGMGLFQLPVTDRDEALFAQASKQMVQSGNYGQIKVQNRNRHLKPPGIYWTQAGLVKLFDLHHSFAIGFFRLASALGAVLSVLLLFYLLRRVIPEHHAFISAALLAASLLLIVEGHLATTDAMLLFTMVLMQGGLLLIYLQQSTRAGPLLFWLGLSLGVLIKGITPAVGFLTLGALILMDRNPRLFLRTRPLQGIGLFILISLAWLIPISLLTHSNFLWDMIKGDLLPKLAGGQQGHGHPFGYFLLISPLLLWPGSLFMGKAIAFAINTRQQAITRFCLAWLVPNWLLFEIVPTKLPEYILPCVPAIMILVALGVSHKLQGRYRIIEGIIRVLWCVFTLGLLIALIMAPRFLHQQATTGQWVTVFVLAMILFFATVRYHKAFAIKGMLVYSAIFYPLLIAVYLPQLSNFWLSDKITRLVQAQPTQHKPLLSGNYQEPSLIFRLGTNAVRFVGSKQQVLKQLQVGQHGLINPPVSQGLTLLGCVTGFEYNGGHWKKLCLVSITGSRH